MTKFTAKEKIAAVQSYLEGIVGYDAISASIGASVSTIRTWVIQYKHRLRSRTQLMNWVRKYQETGDISDLRGNNGGNNGLKNLLKGRPRTKFDSVEEELEYYKAQVAYLKKQYPNL